MRAKILLRDDNLFASKFPNRGRRVRFSEHLFGLGDQLGVLVRDVGFFPEIIVQVVDLDRTTLFLVQVQLDGFPRAKANGPLSTTLKELPIEEIVFPWESDAPNSVGNTKYHRHLLGQRLERFHRA
jgi:hypothetical protein